MAKAKMPNKEDSTQSSSDNLSNLSLPDAATKPFSQENLDAIKQQREQEHQAKADAKPKTRKQKVKYKEFSSEEKEKLIQPLFVFASSIMEKFNVEGLDPEQIKSGSDAFSPLIAYYLPKMEKASLFVPPLFWVGSVVMERLPIIDKPLPVNEPNSRTTKVSHCEPGTA